MTINITSISGQHIYQESGAPVVVESGLGVLISGQHVYVESGVHVITDIQVEVSSGLWVDGISGQHVYVESGVHVIAGYCIGPQGVTVPTTLLTDCNGQLFVWVSGQHVYVESGVHTIPSSGQNVVVESGLGVLVSGQHVYVESGVYLASGLYVVTGTSGNPSRTQITDLSGNVLAISRRHDSLIQMPAVTREVHKGEMYHVGYCESGLAAGTNLDMLIVTASGKEVHAVFGVAAGGTYEAQLYENVTCSDSGTPIIAHNMNRFCSGQPQTLFSIGPTVTSTYTNLWCAIGGGPGHKFGGGGPGVTHYDTEWDLMGVSGSINYLLRIQNNETTDAKDAHLSMEFSEEDPVAWW